eukprot:g1704.t1
MHPQMKRSTWQDADALLLPVGKYEEGWFKTTSIHGYLFGLEFPDTILCMTRTEFHIVTSKKKAVKYFRPAVDRTTVEGCTIRVHALEKKDVEQNKKVFGEIIDAIKASGEGKKIAMMTKELKYLEGGKIYPTWKGVFDASQSSFEIVKATTGIAAAFAEKDSEEVENIKAAGSITAKLFRHGFVQRMETVIDKEIKTTNEKLSEKVEGLAKSPKSIKAKYDPEDPDVEVCFTPVVQSGGSYNVKAEALGVPSDARPFAYDLVIATVGMRYKLYCAKMTRTYFVDASKTQKTAYKCLVAAYEACLKAIKPGAKFSDAHDAARKSLESSKMPQLAKHLHKTVGTGIGIEVKESLALSAKSANVFRVNMAFNVVVALTGVSNEDVNEGGDGAETLKTYDVRIGDTVVVQRGVDDRTGHHCALLTKSKYEWSRVAYNINKDGEESSEGSSEEGGDDNLPEAKGLSKDDRRALKEARAFSGGDAAVVGGGRQTRSSRRASARDRGATESNLQAELRRAERQKELMVARAKKMQGITVDEGVAGDGASKVDESALVERLAYPSATSFPKEARNTSVYVDEGAEVVFVPINGATIPFHISMIKSVSKSDGHRATYLRINFNTPAKTIASQSRNRGAIVNIVKGKFPQAIFLKDISIRSSSAANLTKQLRLIKEMQKRIRTRDRDAKELEDVVEQAPLKLIRNAPRLQDLSMKPHLSGRSTHGSLEAHENGFRFRSVKGEKLDVNYANIKHAIFQPCKNEHTVILHFHLKHPILLNKKKTSDVQFYTEVVERTIALKKSKRSMYDPDEIDEEQRQRQLKKKLNQLFRKFTVRVNKLLESKLGKDPIDFDAPYSELAYKGTVNKAMVTISPCTHCLVNLTEFPFFVVSLDSIDHVHMERASISARTTQFDMVIIMKDRKQGVVKIDAIDRKNIDSIEEWLDSVKISFSKGGTPLNWKQVLIMVRDQELDGFFWKDTDFMGEPKPIGWLFLDEAHAAEVEAGGDDGAEESGSDFAPPSDDDEEASEDDWDPSEDEDEEESSAGEESDGEGWDDLEEDAAREDAKTAKRRRDEEERDRQKRKRRR